MADEEKKSQEIELDTDGVNEESISIETPKEPEPSSESEQEEVVVKKKKAKKVVKKKPKKKVIYVSDSDDSSSEEEIVYKKKKKKSSPAPPPTPVQQPADPYAHLDPKKRAMLNRFMSGKLM